MKRTCNIGAFLAVMCGFILMQTGCNATVAPTNGANGNDNSNGNTDSNNSNGDNSNSNDNSNDNNDTDTLAVVDTGILLHPSSRIEVGDDIIAYTYPAPAGNPGSIDYIIPSEGDTEGRGIPDDENFDYDSFAVSGKKIAIAGNNTTDFGFQVAIFDTVSGTTSWIPEEDVRLATIPVGNSDQGHLQADGDYVVVRHQSSPVIKVIDMGGDIPAVISFAVAPGGASSGFAIPQVLVDAETMTAVAVNSSDDSFYVYDIANPDAEPLAFPTDAFGGLDDGYQYKMDDGVILYGNNDGFNQMYLLDVTDATNTPVELTVGEGSDPEVFNGYYGFLSNEGPSSATAASAVGEIDNTAPVVAGDTTILSNSANWGRFGQGGSIAMGKIGDDVAWFVMGPLQWSTTGGSEAAWNVVYDPQQPDTPLFGGKATTDAAGTTLAFAWSSLGDADETLGYARLDD